jgi:L-iditol 2-dehydrogenase
MPGDVRIEVRAVGICETDLAIWKGDYDVEMPIVLGHEIAGVIHESSVQDIKPGTHVTTEVDVACGHCHFCKNGFKQACLGSEVLGLTADGGLAEYVSVPAELIHPLPEDVDVVAGTFVEPLASAIQTTKVAPAGNDEVVVVIGSGKLGLLIAQVYDSQGADVHLIGRNKWQLGLARQLGLRNTINTENTDWKKVLLNKTSSFGPRLVVEATGNPEGLTMAIDIVRAQGTIALKSMHGKPVGLDTSAIVNREIVLQGSSRGPFEEAIDMLEKGRIEVKRLVSREFSLEDTPLAFDYALRSDVTKVIIRV